MASVVVSRSSDILPIDIVTDFRLPASDELSKNIAERAQEGGLNRGFDSGRVHGDVVCAIFRCRILDRHTLWQVYSRCEMPTFRLYYT